MQTSEAVETIVVNEQRLLTAEDIIDAMAKLGFDSYVGPLRCVLCVHMTPTAHTHTHTHTHTTCIFCIPLHQYPI